MVREYTRRVLPLARLPRLRSRKRTSRAELVMVRGRAGLAGGNWV